MIAALTGQSAYKAFIQILIAIIAPLLLLLLLLAGLVLAQAESQICSADSQLCNMSNTEQTFIMIKPDGVARGLVGDVIKRFEQKVRNIMDGSGSELQPLGVKGAKYYAAPDPINESSLRRDNFPELPIAPIILRTR